MQERMCFLERTLHTVRMEKEHKEREFNDLKNDMSVKKMELSRHVKSLLIIYMCLGFSYALYICVFLN